MRGLLIKLFRDSDTEMLKFPRLGGVREHLPPNRDFVVAAEELPLPEQALGQVVLETRPISCACQIHEAPADSTDYRATL